LLLALFLGIGKMRISFESTSILYFLLFQVTNAPMEVGDARREIVAQLQSVRRRGDKFAARNFHAAAPVSSRLERFTT